MRTVRGRITLWACLILAASIIVVAFLNIYYMTNRISQKEEQILQAKTDFYAEEINTEFMKEINLLKGFKAAIESLDEADDEHIQKIIDNYYSQNAELLNIFFGRSDGVFIKADNGGVVSPDYDPRERSWYKRAIEADDIAVTNPYMAASTKVMCASIAVPVKVDGKTIGVAGLDISLETIIYLVNSINYAKGAYGFLLDSDYCFVTHPIEDYLPREDSKTNILDAYPEIGRDLEHFQEGVVRNNNYDGDSYFFASACVEGCQWTLVVATPTDLVEADTVKTTRMSVVAATIALLIALAVCLILIKKEFNPIKEIIPEVEKVSKGNFDANLQIDLNSMEFARLQRAVQRMVDTLNGIISETNNVLGEISNGNLAVDDMSEYEGEFNEISKSVNSIKATLNALISDIQYSAITLQSTAMGFTGCENADPAELEAIFNELSVEANDLMEKANRFKTLLK